MKLSGLAIASLLSGAALAAPAAAPDASLISDDASSDWALFKRQSAAIKRGRTDNLLFRTTLGGFIQYRNAKNPSWLTWSSNGCNYSPDNPRGYPFLQACQRHDFGYRNYKNQKRFTSANRKKIDDKFHDDLYYKCRQVGGGTDCYALANTYYTFVRGFGGGSRVAPDGLTEIGFELDPYDPDNQTVDDAGDGYYEIDDDAAAYDQWWGTWSTYIADYKKNLAAGLFPAQPPQWVEEQIPEGPGPDWTEGWLPEN